MACDCEGCLLSRRVASLRAFLDKGEHSYTSHIKTLDELYSLHVHGSMDHDRLRAVVEGEWADAEKIMARYGWVRMEGKLSGK